MSRVIKFRAWDEARKKMHTSKKWVEFKFDGNGKLKAVNFKPSGVEQILPLMQFTGLRDVNGVEIWEGDVVCVPGLGNAAVEICPHYGVVFCNKEYRQPYADGAAEGDYPTVLGSIYEHPHLLDGSK